MAQTFFPEVESKVNASCPPHPQNTCYRIAIGKEDWGDSKEEVLKIQMEYDGSVAGRKSPSFPIESNDLNKVLNKSKELLKEWDLKNTDKVTLKLDMYTGEGKLRNKKYIEFYGKELFNIQVDVYASFDDEYGYPQGFSSDYPFYDISSANPGDKLFHKYTFYVTKKDNIVVHTEFFHKEPAEDYRKYTPEEERVYVFYDCASDVKSYSSYNEILTDITDLPIEYRLELEEFFDSKLETEVWDI